MCNFCENGNQCSKKSYLKYGNYCFKHKNNYLLINNKISYERFTSESKDYLKSDIINFLKTNDKEFNKIISKKKKEDLFILLNEQLNIIKKYENNTEKIKIIQENFKNKKKVKNIKLRGEAFTNRKICKNDTDFFSYETINEIDDNYFFSYKDSKGFHWFFDIRSLDKLLEMNQGNPYTREDFPLETILKAKSVINNLKNKKLFEKVDKTIIRDRKQAIKQKTVDLFSQIENFGYECQINWFLQLNIQKLKKLYRNLEDIWNYRLQITNEVKRNIAPPDGLVFNIPIPQVLQYTSKKDLQDLILNEVCKFNNAISDPDKKLGYMYFIIGLGAVDYDCRAAHQWLMYV